MGVNLCIITRFIVLCDGLECKLFLYMHLILSNNEIKPKQDRKDKMDKYYLHSYIGLGLPNNTSSIIRNNSNVQLTIHEDVEMPDFDLYIDKLEEGQLKRPQNSKHEKNREIVKETYSSYFRHALKEIKNCKWEDAEYYWDQKSVTWIDLIMYTTNHKNKFHIHIDIRDSIDSLGLMLSKGRNFAYRQGYRKNGTAISEAIFTSALKETIKFIEDENSYHVNVTDYLKKIKMIVAGNLADVETEKSVNVEQLINQLEIKKRDITNRLIENDSDTENIRASLRGEKEGIDYSLKVIRKFFRLTYI